MTNAHTRIVYLIKSFGSSAALSGLNLDGVELNTAERAARRILATSPYRESACNILMQILEIQGNKAEALIAFEKIRALLKKELGVSLGSLLLEAHKKLLQK
jgi:DNA-binding SARP family transcriptional activator